MYICVSAVLDEARRVLNHGSGTCGGKYEVQYVELHITLFESPQRHAVPCHQSVMVLIGVRSGFPLQSVLQARTPVHARSDIQLASTEFERLNASEDA